MQWSDKGKCVEFGVELGRRLVGWLDYVSLLFISEIIVNNIAELLKVSGGIAIARSLYLAQRRRNMGQVASILQRRSMGQVASILQRISMGLVAFSMIIIGYCEHLFIVYSPWKHTLRTQWQRSRRKRKDDWLLLLISNFYL